MSFRQRKVLDNSPFPSLGEQMIMRMFEDSCGRKMCVREESKVQESEKKEDLTQSQLLKQPALTKLLAQLNTE